VHGKHGRDMVTNRLRDAFAAVEAPGKRLGNYQRIAEAKQRATAARVEAVRPSSPRLCICRRKRRQTSLTVAASRPRAASNGMRCRSIAPAIVSVCDRPGGFETLAWNLSSPREHPSAHDWFIFHHGFATVIAAASALALTFPGLLIIAQRVVSGHG
jgi:hypothetical protein